nr:MAG TPA: hypothetical protein [Caudoviricetes sp.]
MFIPTYISYPCKIFKFIEVLYFRHIKNIIYIFILS